MDDSECVVSQETPFAYYSITSNGLDVQNITVFPSGILPPEGSPRSYGEPQFSPDGSLLAYPASKGLYVVDAMSEGRYLFQPDDTSGTNPVGPVCWMPDGQSLKFVVRHQKDGQWHHTFYRIGLDAADPQVLFSIDDLPSFIWSGICSPDGKEMAFTINPSGGKGDGIYVMNLESGERRQILSHYTVDQIRAPMPAWLQATTESLRESEKIIFAGTPCSLRGPDCAPVPGDPLHYYTINPDGTGLENVLAIPPLLVPPASAPASAFDGPVQPSPDGRMLAYAEINGVYVIDAMTGAASRIPPENSTPFWWFNSYRRAPVCWIEDGTALELKERTSRFRITSPDAKTQEETRVVYLSNPPDTILTWACLPNGEELAFSLSPKGGEQQGLYIMSLRDGEWRQVLRDYEVVSVGVWPSAPLYTYAPIPGPVWQIFFKGAPCAELITGCSGAFPGAPEYNYSIYSDGTGFQEIAKLPSVTDIVLPNGAPGLSQKPHLSPDGLYLVYYSSDHPRGLYIVNNTTGEARSLVRVDGSIPGASQFGPACWTSDGTAVMFYVGIQEAERWQNALYYVDRDGENIRRLFVITGLQDNSIFTGACSPDNHDMVFRLSSREWPLDEEGLYVLNLENGEWRQILAGYEVYWNPQPRIVMQP